MPHDARAIANLVLDEADAADVHLTVMALLKVLYFAHGWHFARLGKPLIDGPFEAWEHGPVVRSVWEAFRGQGDRPVTGRVSRLDPVTRERSVVRYPPSEDLRSFIASMVKAYGTIHAFTLSEMTHAEGSPWHRVWHAPRGQVNLGMKIPDELIREHFLSESARQPRH